VDSFGLSDKFGEVKTMYKEVNEMLGDIVKVTPSSEMVGDMAIFMVQNSLTKENIYEKGKNLTFPDSVVTYFSGMMGQPEGGFPKDLQKLVLKDEKPITVRPGTLLEDEDFDKISEHLEEKYNYKPTIKECLSYALYPKVYEDYRKTLIEYGELSYMSSDVFFHGIREGETCEVEIADGKILIITLLEIGKLDNVVGVVDASRLVDEFDEGKSLLKDGIEEEDIESLLIQQIEFCSTLIVNKRDLVTDEQMKMVRAVINKIQPTVKVIETIRCDVPVEESNVKLYRKGITAKVPPDIIK